MSPTRWLLFIAMLPIFPVGEMAAPQKVDVRLNTSRTNEMVAQTAISSNDGIFTTALAPSDDRKKHFAFGFVEFDWDPRIEGGLPGFDMWPVQEL